MKRLVPCQFCRGALETRRKSPVGGSKWRIRFPSKLGVREYEARLTRRDPGKRQARGSLEARFSKREEKNRRSHSPPPTRCRLESSTFISLSFPSLFVLIFYPPPIGSRSIFCSRAFRGIAVFLKKKNLKKFFRASIEKEEEGSIERYEARVQLELRRESQIDSFG